MTTFENTRREDITFDFDLHDDAIAGSVDEHYAAMRERCPFAYTDHHGGHWVATRYEDMRYMNRNPDIFSSVAQTVPASVGARRLIPIELDPPEHTVYRRVIASLLTPAHARQMEPDIRRLANDIVDEWMGRIECEFMSEFANLLQTRMFITMMDWPMCDAAQLIEWADGFLYGDPQGSDEESARVRGAAAMGFYSYIAEDVARNMLSPGDNWTSIIAGSAKADGEPLTADEVIDLLFMLLLGGVHTVPGSLGYSVHYLAGHPDQRDRLVREPELTASAVEELLRCNGTITAVRTVTKPVEVNCMVFQPGDRIVVPYASAGRDTSEFSDPDVVDLARSPNRHLAFGVGPHRCVGSHLARMQMRVALEVISKRLVNYRLHPERPASFMAGHIRTVSSLHLAFDEVR